MLALLAAAVAWHSLFTAVPGFDGVKVARLAGGRDRLFVVIREQELEPEYHDEFVQNWAVPGSPPRQHLMVVHLPGFEREVLTSRLHSGDSVIEELAWDAAREELLVLSSTNDRCDVALCGLPELPIPTRSGAKQRPRSATSGTTLRQTYEDVGFPWRNTMGEPVPVSR